MNSHRACLVAALLAPVVGCGDNLDPNPNPMADVDAGTEPPEPDAPLPVPVPGITFFDFSIAVDVTPDGRYAVFEDISTEEGTIHIHDTILGTVTETADLGNPARSLATGISATGRISAMRNEPVEASLWSKTGGWTNLGSPHAAGCGADEVSGAFDISADGHVAVGLAWNGCTADAFRWTDAGGAGVFTTLQVIGSSGSSAAPTNRATVVSDDGTVAGGFAENGAIDRAPAIWTANGSGILLDPTNTEAPGEVMSISANGATVAGQSGNDGFVWTAATGMTPLIRFDLALGSDPVFPLAMSADGTLVFGGVGSAFFGVPTAFVWSAEDGMRSIADLAVAAGIALPAGTTLNSILAASADGTVLIGTAMDADLALKTFTLRLPAGAY